MLTKRKGRANLEVMNELSRFCRDLRLSKNFTLQEVAAEIEKRIGRSVSWGTIQAIETGRSRHPARDLLDALAWLYDVPVEVFIMKAYAPAVSPTEEKVASR